MTYGVEYFCIEITVKKWVSKKVLTRRLKMKWKNYSHMYLPSVVSKQSRIKWQSDRSHVSCCTFEGKIFSVLWKMKLNIFYSIKNQINSSRYLHIINFQNIEIHVISLWIHTFSKKNTRKKLPASRYLLCFNYAPSLQKYTFDYTYKFDFKPLWKDLNILG